MIHEEICTYEVAELAKEKGFNGLCYAGYDRKGELLLSNNIPNPNMKLLLTDCIAPTQSILQRWLREEKGYYVYPFFDNENLKWTWVCRELTGDMWIPLVDFEERLFDTYEQALEDGLKYALEILV